VAAGLGGTTLPSLTTTRAARARRIAAALAGAACSAALALHPPAAQAKVYYTAFFAGGGTGVQRAGFDGGGLQTLQFQPVGFADGIAVDAAAGRMYWTDTDASLIWSADLDGEDAQIIFDDVAGEPLGVALDVAQGKLYFTDREGVRRVNLDGSEAELLNKGPARGFLALDLVHRQMYWADWPTGTVKTATMAPEAAVSDVLIKQPAPFGVAVDAAAGKLYWLQLDFSKKKSETEAIKRANVDGSEPQLLLERPGAGFEGGLAIDPAAGRMYWTEGATHLVGVANLDGSDARTLFGTGEDSPEGLAIETADPHPFNTAAPVIEGVAQVGNPLICQPGSWTGTGPVTVTYQWLLAGAGAIEGATSSVFVPSADEVGGQVICSVSAADRVETTAASSAPVTVLAPSVEPLVLVRPAPLLAGIALDVLTISGTRARVPVFTTLAGRATLRAVPQRPAIAHGRAPAARRHRTARAQGRRQRAKRGTPAVAATRRLSPGRATIRLGGLVRGRSYRLALSFVSADGQSASDSATLRVRAR
jgi:hypothetical protein